MKAGEKFIVFHRILFYPLADRSETGLIAYCFMRDCVHKVGWVSMKDRVPSGRRKFKPMIFLQQALKWGDPCESWKGRSYTDYLTHVPCPLNTKASLIKYVKA